MKRLQVLILVWMLALVFGVATNGISQSRFEDCEITFQSWSGAL